MYEFTDYLIKSLDPNPDDMITIENLQLYPDPQKIISWSLCSP